MVTTRGDDEDPYAVEIYIRGVIRIQLKRLPSAGVTIITTLVLAVISETTAWMTRR